MLVLLPIRRCLPGPSRGIRNVPAGRGVGMTSAEIYPLLERLVSFARADVRAAGLRAGLHPVHVDALRYLGRCNRFSDTPLAVAEYLGLTRGTVSQTLKLLEARGLVSRSPDPTDRRVVHLHLTTAARRFLDEAVPGAALCGVLAGRPPEENEALRQRLEVLLDAWNRARAGASFGVCETCRWQQAREDGAECALQGVELSARDRRAICRDHELPGAP